jgi:hypothetical protein
MIEIYEEYTKQLKGCGGSFEILALVLHVSRKSANRDAVSSRTCLKRQVCTRLHQVGDAIHASVDCSSTSRASSGSCDGCNSHSNAVHCNTRAFILMLFTTINSGQIARCNFSKQACTMPMSREPFKSMKILLNLLPHFAATAV